MGETVVHLQSGDFLYMPAFWGHQTFSGNAGPTISLSSWFFPVAVDPATRPGTDPINERELAPKATLRNVGMAVLAATSNGDAWAGLRTLVETLASAVAPHLLNTPGGAELVDRWIRQRWQPQFGALGLHRPHWTPDGNDQRALAVCGPATGTVRATIQEGVKTLLDLLESMAAWHLTEHRIIVLELFACNFFDGVLEFLPAFSTELANKGVADNQIGVLLASFGNC